MVLKGFGSSKPVVEPVVGKYLWYLRREHHPRAGWGISFPLAVSYSKRALIFSSDLSLDYAIWADLSLFLMINICLLHLPS